MSHKAHGQLRRGQVITTYGPGALIDLPKHSAIVGGLDTWPKPHELEEVVEPRLAHKLAIMTGVATPKLYAPPPEPSDPRETARGIGAWRFPEWFVVQDEGGGEDRQRSRRLVHRKALDERAVSMAAWWLRPASFGRAREGTWTTWTGGTSCTRRMERAALARASFGSMSAERAAISRTWSCVASVAGSGACTRLRR
jgi:hypothetical protein